MTAAGQVAAAEDVRWTPSYFLPESQLGPSLSMLKMTGALGLIDGSQWGSDEFQQILPTDSKGFFRQVDPCVDRESTYYLFHRFGGVTTLILRRRYWFGTDRDVRARFCPSKNGRIVW